VVVNLSASLSRISCAQSRAQRTRERPGPRPRGVAIRSCDSRRARWWGPPRDGIPPVQIGRTSLPRRETGSMAHLAADGEKGALHETADVEPDELDDKGRAEQRAW